MWIIPLNAGQVRHSIVSTHNKYEAKHDPYSEVDPLICHGGYHFPGILTRVVSLHTVKSRHSQINKNKDILHSQMYAFIATSTMTKIWKYVIKFLSRADLNYRMFSNTLSDKKNFF